MALPLFLQGIAGGLLGQGLFNAYNDRNRSGLLGSLGTPDRSYMEYPANMSGPDFNAQPSMVVEAGTAKPGTGLLGTLQGMDPAAAEQIAPLLQQMPYQDLRRVAGGLVGSMFQPQQGENPQIVEGADGFKYWATGPNAGQRVLPNVNAKPREDNSFKHESDLRGEFTKGSKEFNDVTSSFARMNASMQQQTPASDIALIFQFMKMLDPQSVVREGEFATAEQTAGLPQYVVNLYNRAVDGKRLSPEQRNEFFRQATNIYENAIFNQNRFVDRYTQLAGQYGVSPDRVIYDYQYPRERWFNSSNGNGGGGNTTTQPPPGFTEEVR